MGHGPVYFEGRLSLEHAARRHAWQAGRQGSSPEIDKMKGYLHSKGMSHVLAAVEYEVQEVSDRENTVAAAAPVAALITEPSICKPTAVS